MHCGINNLHNFYTYTVKEKRLDVPTGISTTVCGCGLTKDFTKEQIQKVESCYNYYQAKKCHKMTGSIFFRAIVTFIIRTRANETNANNSKSDI